MSEQLAVKIFQRYQPAADWINQNPVLGRGEMGIEEDTSKFKFGNGVTPWIKLPYASQQEILSVDGALSSVSTNPIQNKAVYEALQGYLSKKGGDLSLGAYLQINDEEQKILLNGQGMSLIFNRKSTRAHSIVNVKNNQVITNILGWENDESKKQHIYFWNYENSPIKIYENYCLFSEKPRVGEEAVVLPSELPKLEDWVSKENIIKALGFYPAKNEVATQEQAGLMSKLDKTRLDNLEEYLIDYTLPVASSTLGAVKTTSQVQTAEGYIACPIVEGVVYYSEAKVQAKTRKFTEKNYLLCTELSPSYALNTGSNYVDPGIYLKEDSSGGLSVKSLWINNETSEIKYDTIGIHISAPKSIGTGKVDYSLYYPQAEGTLALLSDIANQPLANGPGQAGLIQTTSSIRDKEGLIACPVINGVPYYKINMSDGENVFIQSDYEENDPTSLSYILNRPFFDKGEQYQSWGTQYGFADDGVNWSVGWQYPIYVGARQLSRDYSIHAHLINPSVIPEPTWMIGGIVEIVSSFATNSTPWTLTEEELHQTDDGFCFIYKNNLSEDGVAIVFVAKNTNYAPFGYSFPKAGIYVSSADCEHDHIYVVALRYVQKELKYLDNKYIDLKNHPDYNNTSESAIIDCATLPVDNINDNILYRTNNIQFVFERNVGMEGTAPANVYVVEDVTKLAHSEIIPYATSNPTARNWYYDLGRQHGYCYFDFDEIPVADKNNPRYDWIDKTATSGYQWFDPEWIYRDQNGYGGTVSSYDEIPTTGYKSVYFIGKTDLYYYDSNTSRWVRIQEEFVNNTNYDVVPTIMRKSSAVSYKTYTDGAGSGTLALRTGDGFLRARSAKSGPGGDWSSPLDDFTLVNKGFLRNELANFGGGVSEERVSEIIDALNVEQYTTENEVDEQISGAIEALKLPETYVSFENNLGYEVPNTRTTIYKINDGQSRDFYNSTGSTIYTYYKVSDNIISENDLRGNVIITREQPYDDGIVNTKLLRIGRAELAKAKTYSGGTYLYALGIWIVRNYAILGDANPGFTSNGIYFVKKEIDHQDATYAWTEWYQTMEIYSASFKTIDNMYIPQHHIVPIPLYSDEILRLLPNHKYAFQSGEASQKIYLANGTDAGMDASISGQITCGEKGASVSDEYNFRALAIGQVSNNILSGKLMTSKNIELTPGSYLKNTGSSTCWIWDEYFE